MMVTALATRLTFSPMQDTDIDAVTAAEQRAHPFPWTRGNFTDSLQAGHSVWVCREADAMIGYGVLMMALDAADLLNITVLPEYQRRGLGSDLLCQLLEIARAHGAARMVLEVRPSNAAALALYRRFLFSEIGRRKGYYDGREDAIVMAREL
jgi:ribosomal-protein-alanine N-acetyltransferase